MPNFSNDFIYFETRQLAALSWLCSLCNFDLQFIGIHQIVNINSEPGRGHLFYAAIQGIAIGQRIKTGFVLTAFTGITFGIQAIHGQSNGFMGFFADGTERHRRGDKTFQNGFNRLNFVKRDAFHLFNFKQTAQCGQLSTIGINGFGIFFKKIVIALPHGTLQQNDHFRCHQMLLCFSAIMIVPAGWQKMPFVRFRRTHGFAKSVQGFRFNNIKTYAANR